MTPVNHSIHAFRVTFKKGFNSSIRKVSHPSGNAFPNCCIASKRTKEHPLYPSADPNSSSLLVHHGLYTADARFLEISASISCCTTMGQFLGGTTKIYHEEHEGHEG